MAYIGQDPVIGRYILVDQISGGFNGTASGFTLAAGGQGVIPGLAQNVLLSLGGVIQQPGTDYTVSGSGITFTTPPLSGTTFFATVLGDVQAVGTPSDGTVLPASIATSGTFVFPNITTTGTTLIASGNASTPSLAVIGDTNTGLYSPGADQLAISTGGTGRLFVDATGNVGVGAVSDTGASKLFIAGNGTAGLTNIVTIRTASGNSYGLQIKGNNTNDEWSIQNYYNAALIFGTNNTERMRITNGGLVGVGTSDPKGTLHVAGTTGITQALTAGEDALKGLVNIGTVGTSGGSLVVRTAGVNANEASGLGIDGTYSHPVSTINIKAFSAASAAYSSQITFQTQSGSASPTERLRIDSSGRVGIGTTSPGTRFDVISTASASTAITRFKSGTAVGDRGVEIASDTNSNVFIQGIRASDNTSGYQLCINPSGGNVGIGTTSPGATLDVRGVSYFSDWITTGSSSSSKGISSDSSGRSLLFAINQDEKARIDTSGRLLVGTTNGQAQLTVWDTSTSVATARIFKNAASSQAMPALMLDKYDNTSTTSQVFVQFSINNQGTGSGQINANGASQVAFGSYSDARLKENITDLPSQWAALKQLRPVEFDYIESEGGGHQVGFIAQEVQEIYPDVVGERGDGLLTLSGMGKNESRLIKALQEAIERIETLEARLTALEGA